MGSSVAFKQIRNVVLAVWSLLTKILTYFNFIRWGDKAKNQKKKKQTKKQNKKKKQTKKQNKKKQQKNKK